MSGLIQGEVIAPHADETSIAVQYGERTSGSAKPFDLAFLGQWEFVTPERLKFDPAPPRGGIRTWRVEPIHSEGEWLPQITEVREEAGANGSREIGTGRNARLDPMPHLMVMAQKPGAVVFPNGDQRLGAYARFRARFPLRGYSRGGWFYTFAGTSLRQINPTTAIPEPDRGWIVGLRRQTVRPGAVAPMDISILDQHVAVLRNRLEAFSKRLDSGKMHEAAYQRRVTETERTITTMQAAWQRQFGSTLTEGPLVNAVLDDDSAPVPVAPKSRK